MLFSLLPLPAWSLNLSYSDLEEQVRLQNLHVRAADRADEAIQHREGYLLRSYLPRIELNAGYEGFQKTISAPTAQPFAGAEARFNLFNSGRDLLDSRIRSAQSAASAADRSRILRDELLKTQTEYLEATYLTEQAQLLESRLQRNEKNLQAARRRVKAGLVSESDTLEFELNQRLIQQDLSNNKTLLANSLQKLNVLIGRNPGDPLRLVDALPSEPDFSDSDLILNPDALSEVVLAETSSRIAELEYSKAVRWWAPRLDVYLSARQMTMRDADEFLFANRREFVAGAKLTIELFDGGESISNARSMGALAQSHEDRALQNLRELNVEFQNAKAELRQLSELIREASKDVKKSEEYLEKILSEYSRGVKDSSSVLSASDRTYEYQRRFADLRRSYQISKAKIQSLTQK